MSRRLVRREPVGVVGAITPWNYPLYLNVAKLGPALAAFPRLARFPTEFGAQALPESDDFVEQERWPDLEWPRLGRTHALQRDRFDRYVPASEHDTYKGWKAATQAYQCRAHTSSVSASWGRTEPPRWARRSEPLAA